MKYLFDHLDSLGAVLAERGVYLLLDFDGTLSPIAMTPDAAELPDETRRELERLANCAACEVAVISGRALDDVQARVGIAGLTYIGNHGLEKARPHEPPERLELPELRAVIPVIKRELMIKLDAFPGAIVEDKGCAIAVHYRTVSPEQRPLVKAVVGGALEACGGEAGLRLVTGSMVLELRPSNGRNKGTIVAELLASNGKRGSAKGPFAIYLGDDATDEDAFRAVRGRGWGVLVGEPRISYAEYYLRDPDDVRTLLRLVGEAACGGS
jgi:trehalose-phosphatase